MASEMAKHNLSNILVFFFIFLFLLAVEVIMDIFLLPADEVLVPGEVIMDVLIFTVMAFTALSGGGSKAMKVRE